MSLSIQHKHIRPVIHEVRCDVVTGTVAVCTRAAVTLPKIIACMRDSPRRPMSEIVRTLRFLRHRLRTIAAKFEIELGKRTIADLDREIGYANNVDYGLTFS